MSPFSIVTVVVIEFLLFRKVKLLDEVHLVSHSCNNVSRCVSNQVSYIVVLRPTAVLLPRVAVRSRRLLLYSFPLQNELELRGREGELTWAWGILSKKSVLKKSWVWPSRLEMSPPVLLQMEMSVQ